MPGALWAVITAEDRHLEGKLPQVDSEAYTVDPTVNLLGSEPIAVRPPPATSLLTELEVNPILLRMVFESSRGLGGA